MGNDELGLNHIIAAKLKTTVREREALVLDKLVGKFRSGKMSKEEAIAGIAGISELRIVCDNLDREIRCSERELESLVNRR
jgi:hypothetical protein